MSNCKECGREREKRQLRRGLCIRCYRSITGLSGGKDYMNKVGHDIKTIKGRIKALNEFLLEIKGIENVNLKELEKNAKKSK